MQTNSMVLLVSGFTAGFQDEFALEVWRVSIWRGLFGPGQRAGVQGGRWIAPRRDRVELPSVSRAQEPRPRQRTSRRCWKAVSDWGAGA